MNTIYAELTTPLQQTRVDIFEEIFLVFLGLGTLVGVIVVAYTLYNAYKYRDTGTEETDKERPTLGELPTGGQGGKKLFLSFGLSAIIVISLVVWSYGMLLAVEGGPDDNPGEDAVEIDVEGFAFGWAYEYDYQGEQVSQTGELVVPEDESLWLNVTSRDVWHTFGIPEERVKADAIPGEYDETWFIAEEPGEYEGAVQCFELCGFGHTDMYDDLVVVDSDLFDAMYEEDAIDVFLSGLAAEDLDVDSDPDEFQQYLEEERADDDEDGDESDEETGDDEDETDDGNENDETDTEGGDD